MRLLDLIYLDDPEVTPEETKVHLASWNGLDHPLDVYLAGEFEEWQRQQNRRNFERRFVLSLIAMPETDRWLFAGVHESSGVEEGRPGVPVYYHFSERAGCAALNGRVVARFRRPGRQSYLNAENWADQILLDEVRPERIHVAGFPGYRATNLSKADLDLIVRQQVESWRVALSSVAGVYLISDTATGDLYVGSASGQGGIWQRWTEYAVTGHGGNVELRRLIREEGNERARAFRYSVLETLDLHAGQQVVLEREVHWKSVLLTRAHGLNGN